jgi:hypothetical protein
MVLVSLGVKKEISFRVQPKKKRRREEEKKLLADPNFWLFCFRSCDELAAGQPLLNPRHCTDIKGAPERERGPDNPCTGQNDRHEAGETVRPASSKNENNRQLPKK